MGVRAQLSSRTHNSRQGAASSLVPCNVWGPLLQEGVCCTSSFPSPEHTHNAPTVWGPLLQGLLCTLPLPALPSTSHSPLLSSLLLFPLFAERGGVDGALPARRGGGGDGGHGWVLHQLTHVRALACSGLIGLCKRACLHVLLFP